MRGDGKAKEFWWDELYRY
jgi:hypothetical protein